MTLGYTDILELITNRHIYTKHEDGLPEPQPASLDVPLTREIYRMPCSMLPDSKTSVGQLVQDRAFHRVLNDTLLEVGHYYLAKSTLVLNLPEHISGNANNKSSSGRINLQGRLVLDGVPCFDTIPKGYQGEVWVELHPELAPIDIRNGLPPINQIRLREGKTLLQESELRERQSTSPLLFDWNGELISPQDLTVGPDGHSIHVGIHLKKIQGWRGIRRIDQPLTLWDKANLQELFFEKIPNIRPTLILMKDDFYILGSEQRVRNPLDVCITMRPFQAEHGEFRSHFAGFFDPGNGINPEGIQGFTVTMEVIPMETAIEIKHGQPMFSIEAERLRQPCPAAKAYGHNRGSHYHCHQGPQLARWFKPHWIPKT
jgi:dCTP deaminase